MYLSRTNQQPSQSIKVTGVAAGRRTTARKRARRPSFLPCFVMGRWACEGTDTTLTAAMAGWLRRPPESQCFPTWASSSLDTFEFPAKFLVFDTHPVARHADAAQTLPATKRGAQTLSRRRRGSHSHSWAAAAAAAASVASGAIALEEDQEEEAAAAVAAAAVADASFVFLLSRTIVDPVSSQSSEFPACCQTFCRFSHS